MDGREAVRWAAGAGAGTGARRCVQVRAAVDKQSRLDVLVASLSLSLLQLKMQSVFNAYLTPQSVLDMSLPFAEDNPRPSASAATQLVFNTPGN